MLTLLVINLPFVVAFSSWIAAVVLGLRWPFVEQLQPTVDPLGISRHIDLCENGPKS